MVTRCVYSSVSTHTLIPSPYRLLCPLSGASRVADILCQAEQQGHGPWLNRAHGGKSIITTAVAFQQYTGGASAAWRSHLIVWRVYFQVGLWLGLVSVFSSKYLGKLTSYKQELSLTTSVGSSTSRTSSTFDVSYTV